MATFVWLEEQLTGRQIPVNADQVMYLKPTTSGAQTAVVFAAFAGGIHSIMVNGDLETIAKQLAGPPHVHPPKTAEEIAAAAPDPTLLQAAAEGDPAAAAALETAAATEAAGGKPKPPKAP